MSKLLKLDSNQFPECLRWLARDADGQWWAFEHEPHLAETSWYENEVGMSIPVEKPPDSSAEIVDWGKSLQKIGG